MRLRFYLANGVSTKGYLWSRRAACKRDYRTGLQKSANLQEEWIGVEREPSNLSIRSNKWSTSAIPRDPLGRNEP